MLCQQNAEQVEGRDMSRLRPDNLFEQTLGVLKVPRSKRSQSTLKRFVFRDNCCQRSPHRFVSLRALRELRKTPFGCIEVACHPRSPAGRSLTSLRALRELRRTPFGGIAIACHPSPKHEGWRRGRDSNP